MQFLRTLRARLRREHGVPSGFTKIELPEGGRLLVDQTMLEYLNSTAPDPSQGVLDAVMAEVRRVRVLRGGMASDEPLEKVVLFETAKDKAVSRLRETLRIVDGPAGHCMCYGDPTLELLGASSQRLAFITVHHGQSIRWKSWRHDARLVAGRSLLEWLAGHGATYPLEEYEANVCRQRAERGAWERWLAAMGIAADNFPIDIKTEDVGRSALDILVMNAGIAETGQREEALGILHLLFDLARTKEPACTRLPDICVARTPEQFALRQGITLRGRHKAYQRSQKHHDDCCTRAN